LANFNAVLFGTCKLFSFSSNTRAVQPVATCHQSPYLHKPAIVIVTLFSLRRFAAPVLIMTSFSLWRHSLLSWPHPPLRTYKHLTAF